MTFNNNIPVDKNLLIIGGSGRNVGKTTLATSIINKISATTPTIGLKVSTFKKGNEQYHGAHTPLPLNSFRINTETCVNPQKDTAKMVFSGASEAYFIETFDTLVPQAYNEFKRISNSDGLPVVCESQSLRYYVKPGLFILIIDSRNSKKFTEEKIKLADFVCYTGNDQTWPEKLTSQIHFTSEGWVLNKTLPLSRDEDF